MKIVSDKYFNALRSSSKRIANPPDYMKRALSMYNIADKLSWQAVKDFGYEIDLEFMFCVMGIFEAEERKARQDRLKRKAEANMRKMRGR